MSCARPWSCLVCVTLNGVDLRERMSLGERTWGSVQARVRHQPAGAPRRRAGEPSPAALRTERA
ncbi:hypothetical protein [Nonomuraea soli]|uniref:Uncharacterized protein n=1 Tax=Nonomuraea soli TaxID=1032476 RepID=A0A7W0CRX1_9ACTN|nr:hypothetical protein [Nonomuraea soli]MBA2896157.1 hypothetical protein [Nonomuraea soli]